MNRDETLKAVEAEILKFGESLARITVQEVRDLFAAEVGKYGPGRVALQGLRTEVSAALQLKNPAPHRIDPELAKGPITKMERDSLHLQARATVSDAHRLLSDHARQLDPHHSDAHHFVQKLHAMAIWREVDRIIAEAGIQSSGGSS